MEYLFTHEGQAYAPSGRVELSSGTPDERNRATEKLELAWLQTAPERVFLYVFDAVGKAATDTSIWYGRWRIGTWLGTLLDEHAYFGRSVPVGGIAGRYARKRSVECRIFGVRYVGWYYETAGDYCRLRKAKVQ